MNVLKKTLYILLFSLSLPTIAQDDLMNLLDEVVEEEPVPVAYTFKSTRIINSHTIERMTAKQLDFRVNHRFGEIKSGYDNFWGLDNALISLDFGYGINDWMMVGLRRSTYKKTIDGSFKFSLFRQMEGAKNIPVAVSYYTNMAIDGTRDIDPLIDSLFTNRLSFTNQLLIARKFNEKFSLQIMPTFVHRNLVNYNEDNNIYAIGVGGRLKVTRRLSLTFEHFWTSHGNYYAQSEESEETKFYHPISLGFDLETGGHVFQLFLTNTRIMEESGFIAETNSNPMDGGIYFGFNISRVFAVGKTKH